MDTQAHGAPISGWRLRLASSPAPGTPPEVVRALSAPGGVPASVPGTVHTDLLAAGLIDDPYLDDAEARLAWVGRCDWRYEADVDHAAGGGHERLDLVLDGLDTVAVVEVDGAVLASTANMHRSHRLDVRPVLRGGSTLAITFASPVVAADTASVEMGWRPQVNTHPYNAVRKMACSYGWDWGPDLPTSGAWRPVSLEAWSVARLASVRPVATVAGVTGDHPSGHLAVHVEVERSGAPGADRPLAVEVTLHCPGGDPLVARTLVPSDGATALVELEVQDVALWWPVGHGDPARHHVRVVLDVEREAAGAHPLDVWSGHVGFRTVEWDTSADTAPSGPHGVLGSSMTLLVNGRPVFVKGVNWIPDDCFPHRVDRERYAARIEQARGAGVNLLRVWGGGIFESDDFYDLCDDAGLLTWQDFLFACAAYAEEEPLRSEVEAEARENVARLAHHPSLVMWSGCNENLWGHEEWGWEARLDGRTWGAGYYYDLLPRIVAELSPQVPYTPGSPFSSMEPVADGGLFPNDDDHGTAHLWEQWNEKDYATYRDHAPRFAAEWGWQGPPTMATLRRALSDDPLTPESPGMLAHQKAINGDEKLVDGLAPHFRIPDGIDDWHWATSLNQARAVRLGVEHLRSLSPHCSGSIYWQLNDCWPVTSWAVVDGDGRPKPAWYALRAAHADRLLTIQPRPGGLTLVVVNDSDEALTGPVEVRRTSFDGTVVAAEVLDVCVAARATLEVVLPDDVAAPGAPDRELVVATASGDAGRRGSRALWFFAEDRDSALARQVDALSVSVHPEPGGYRVDLAATSLVRDVAVLADRLDPGARTDEMLVTLLAGERASVRVSTAVTLDAGHLASSEVLRSATQLVTDVRRIGAASSRG